jgi:alpha-acetolactate decarboxylase
VTRQVLIGLLHGLLHGGQSLAHLLPSGSLGLKLCQ